MPKPHRSLVLLLCVPFLAGCFTVTQVPLPSVAAEREQLNVRGVVVRRSGGVDEVVRFDEVISADWTPTALSVVGTRDDENGNLQTATLIFQIPEISGLLVRQLDAGKTSGIIGGVIVGAVAIIALLVTGSACDQANPALPC